VTRQRLQELELHGNDLRIITHTNWEGILVEIKRYLSMHVL